MATVKTQSPEKNEVPAGTTKVREYLPEVDIYQDDKSIYLEAGLPGVDEKSLEISMEKNILTITGKNQTPVPEGFDLKYREYKTGNYHRSFQLNEQIDSDNIEAVIKNGVLRLRLPIKEPVVKKITVKVD